MCGIVGAVAQRNVSQILLEGLSRLEYRGYDSAGICTINNGALNCIKTTGKVKNLKEAVKEKGCPGFTGIAHTRWATHGVPSEVNAHPHVSESGNITLVHNGILENYATLREQLKQRGFAFKSETETEVLVQLIEYVMNVSHESLAESVRLALRQVIGAYAIAVIDRR